MDHGIHDDTDTMSDGRTEASTASSFFDTASSDLASTGLNDAVFIGADRFSWCGRWTLCDRLKYATCNSGRGAFLASNSKFFFGTFLSLVDLALL
jgi:hypothetical protein